MQAAAEVEAALRSDDFTLVEACLGKHRRSPDPSVKALLPRLVQMHDGMIEAARQELRVMIEWDDPEAIAAQVAHLTMIFGDDPQRLQHERIVLERRVQDLNDAAALRMHRLLSSTSYAEITAALIEYEGFDEGEAARMWEELFQHKRRLQDQINDEIIAARESNDIAAVRRLLNAAIPFGDQVCGTAKEALEQRLLYLLDHPPAVSGRTTSAGLHVPSSAGLSSLAKSGHTTHEARMAEFTSEEALAAAGHQTDPYAGLSHVPVEEMDELRGRLAFSVGERRELEARLVQARRLEWEGVIERRRLMGALREERQQTEQLRRLTERELTKMGVGASSPRPGDGDKEPAGSDASAARRALCIPLERQLAKQRAEAHRAVRQAITATERRLGAQYAAREAALRAELASVAHAVEERDAAEAKQRAGTGGGVAAAQLQERLDEDEEDGPEEGARSTSPGRRTKSPRRRGKGKSRGKKDRAKSPRRQHREQSDEVIHRLLESEQMLRSELWEATASGSPAATSSSPGTGRSPRSRRGQETEEAVSQELQQAMADVAHWQGLYANATASLKEAQDQLEVRAVEAEQFAELASINDELLAECEKLYAEAEARGESEQAGAVGPAPQTLIEASHMVRSALPSPPQLPHHSPATATYPHGAGPSTAWQHPAAPVSSVSPAPRASTPPKPAHMHHVDVYDDHGDLDLDGAQRQALALIEMEHIQSPAQPAHAMRTSSGSLPGAGAAVAVAQALRRTSSYSSHAGYT